MNWNLLTSLEQLDQIDYGSQIMPVMILKHSTTCGISAMALARLERKWKEEDQVRLKPYYLDLLRYREISNEIERRYAVAHQSPQILVLRNAKCVYNTSHSDISYDTIMAELQNL